MPPPLLLVLVVAAVLGLLVQEEVATVAVAVVVIGISSCLLRLGRASEHCQGVRTQTFMRDSQPGFLICAAQA